MAALLGWVVRGARWGGSLTAFLPNSGSIVQRALVQGLHKGQASRLLLLAIKGGTENARVSTSRRLAALLRQEKSSFVLVANGSRGLARGFQRFLFHHRYMLAPQGLWSAAILHQDLERDLGILESPAGLNAGEVLADPTGALLAAVRPWSHESGPLQRHGVWVSRDLKSALLLVEMRASGFAVGPARSAKRLIERAFRQASGGAPLYLELGGTGAVTVAANEAVARSAQILTIIDVLLVVGILLFVYRSWRPLALSLVPLVTGAAVATATVALIFPEITVTTLGFGTMLIGVAMDYPAYVLLHVRPGEPLAHAAGRVSKALLLAAAAMVIGFLTMVLSHLSGLVQLGVFAGTGLVTAALAARFLLPLMMPVGRFGRDFSVWAQAAQKLLRGTRRMRWGVVVMAVLAAGFLIQRGAGVWDNRLSALSPAPRSLMKETGRLAREFGVPGLSSLLVVVAQDHQQALRRSEALVPTLARLQAQHSISAYELAAQYLPSVATQMRRKAALPRQAALLRQLRQAAAGLPFHKTAFRPFLQAVAEARHSPPVRLRDAPAAVRAKVGALLMTMSGKSIAFVHLTGVTDPSRIARAIARAHVKGTHFVVVKTAVGHLLTRYRRALLYRSLEAAVLMVLVIAVGLGSIAQAVRLCVPMGAAILTTCAVLVAWGPGLTLLNVVALLLIAGLGMGYALFLGDNGLIAEPQASAPWVCAATTITGFGVMAFSSVALLQSVGLTVSIGAFLALIFTASWSSEGSHRAQRERYVGS